jgi:hypothetical protein
VRCDQPRTAGQQVVDRGAPFEEGCVDPGRDVADAVVPEVPQVLDASQIPARTS